MLVVPRPPRGSAAAVVPEHVQTAPPAWSPTTSIYLANLVALEQWYRQVRRPFFEAQELGPLVYEGALDALASARAERAKRLTPRWAKVTAGRRFRVRSSASAPRTLVAVFDATRAAGRGRFPRRRSGAFAAASPRPATSQTVQALPPEVSRSGVRWLQEIVDDLCGQAAALVPSSGLFPAA